MRGRIVVRSMAGLAGLLLLLSAAAISPPGPLPASVSGPGQAAAGDQNASVPPEIVLVRPHLNPWDNLTAIIRSPQGVEPSADILTPDNRSVNASSYLRPRGGRTWALEFPLPSISPVPLGTYRLRVHSGGAASEANFTVDSLSVSAVGRCWSDSCRLEIRVESALAGGPVEANATVAISGPDNATLLARDIPVAGEANFTFSPWMPGEYLARISAEDARGIRGEGAALLRAPAPGIELTLVPSKTRYSPGETISALIKANVTLDWVNASLRTPGGRVLPLSALRVNETSWLVEYPLVSLVELGEYGLSAVGWVGEDTGTDEISIWIDVLEVEAEADVETGLILVRVSGAAAGEVSGANVTVGLSGPLNLSTWGVTEGGLAELPLPDLPPGNYSYSVEAIWGDLSAEARGALQISGAQLQAPRLLVPRELRFRVGEGVSVSGGITPGTALVGNITVSYTLTGPDGRVLSEGELVVNAPGNFTLHLGDLSPGNYTLSVVARLGRLTARGTTSIAVLGVAGPCAPAGEASGVPVSVDGACIEEVLPAELPEGAWLFAGRKVVALSVSLRGNPGFEAELEIGRGSLLAVVGPDWNPLRPQVAEGGRRISLLDGGWSDPDGSADGRASVVLLVELAPALSGLPAGGPVEVAGRTLPPAERRGAREKLVRPALVKVLDEFEARGRDGTWRVQWLEVLRPGAYRLDPKLGGARAVARLRGVSLEAREGQFLFDSPGRVLVEVLIDEAPAAPPARQAIVSPGKLLVELPDKREGEWRRVTVELPPGALVRRVLALGNVTRDVETWYQSGTRLVFYDDPNRYYYILYDVPEWWDPDGPNSGEDWHYRVPISVPAGDQHQMVIVDVNFTDLLLSLDVTGTLDNNSVRVVDPSGNLVPRQEYIPTGPGVGTIKFLLPSDLSSQETFYVYFDVLENGAKSPLNTLNTGVDRGDLAYWLHGKSPGWISSVIGASPRGPYTIDGGTTGFPPPNPRIIVDDGLPAVGEYSLVLGYRVNESEDRTPNGENTWAAYEITVPSGGGSLTFWFRVESWDSQYFDYLIVTIRDTGGNTLDTVLVYNPNPGTSYGTFADSGWWIATGYDLTPYAGQTIRVNFTVHTYWDDWYKTWAYVDNLIWCNLSATVLADMAEGFGVNLTEPSGPQTFGPLRIVARVDASPTGGILARVYGPSGDLIASGPLYDDGTHGDAVAGDGVFTNDDIYTISPGDPLGGWRVVVLANDSSASTHSPSYDGLIHIPGRPYEVNYTDFFNVDEASFEVRANLTGIVHEDRWPLAAGYSLGVDLPVPSASVGLFLDDGDGEFDPYSDPLVRVVQTNSAGGYSFLARNGTYWIVVDSKTVTSPRGLNAGSDWGETWAEGTYVVSWDGSAHRGSPDFGGRDPEVSDACSLDVIFYDGLETWTGWTDYGAGTVYQSGEQSYEGSFSLKKDSNNDPNGGYRPLSETVGRGIVLQGYAYRPAPWSGGSIDRVGVEDSSFNGYSFAVNHNTNRIWIDRRDGGTPVRISARVPWDPPENGWYLWRLTLFENGTIAFGVYDLNGTPLAEVRATDSTYSSFDRVVVHGGYEYYVDELTLWRPGGRCEHVSLVSVGDYLGESLDFGFSFDVVVNSLDEDHDPANPRAAQGTLRQFILNANAISGGDRSWFVFAVPPNVQADPSHAWWRIDVNDTLGQLPAIRDGGTEINGTVFDQDLSPKDANPGALGIGGRVGTGPDGVPGSGDEPSLPAYSLPEVAIYGQGHDFDGLAVSGASDVKIANVSVYGFYSRYGPGAAVHVESGSARAEVYGCFVGLRPDGLDPGAAGEARNSQLGVLVEGDSARVVDSVVAYNWGTGAHFSGSDVKSGLVQGCAIFSNGLKQVYDPSSSGGPDGMSAEGLASGVVVRENLISNNTCYGIDSWFAPGGLRVAENNITLNGWAPYEGEAGGVRIFGNGSVVELNSIHSNHGVGVVIARTAPPPGWGAPGNALDNNLSRNSIFNNTALGVDIDNTTLAGVGNPTGDGVTVNDGVLSPGAPNLKVDYPVISHSEFNGTHVYVEGFINSEDTGSGSPEFAGALVEVFMVNNSRLGDDLEGNLHGDRYYGEGAVYLGSLTADADGEFSGWIRVSDLPDGMRPEEGSLLTATATISGAGTSEFGPDARVQGVRINVSVRKSLSPSTPCYYGVTLNVTNWSPTPAPSVRVYDVIPANMVLESPSPPYSGSSGNVYWWTVSLSESGSPGSSQLISYTLRAAACGAVEYNLSDAFTVGVDPPDGYLNISASEFIDLILYPDSTYEVRRVWGFLTVSNPTADVISDVWLWIDSTGMRFYPDYPYPSGLEVSPPLHIPELRPGDYWRWRYEVDPALVTPPVTAAETAAPTSLACGRAENLSLSIALTFTDDLRDVSLVKRIPAWFDLRSAHASGGTVRVSGDSVRWDIGDVVRGSTYVLNLLGAARMSSGGSLPPASLTFKRDDAMILDRIREVHSVGAASIQVEKNLSAVGMSVRARFTNLASDLTYNLTRVCVWEGSPPPDGRLVFCETPLESISPGDTWVGPWRLDAGASGVVKYYPRANFTVVPVVGGVQVPLSEAVNGTYLVRASLIEPNVSCRGAPAPSPPELTFSKTVGPSVASIGDVVTFKIRVSNVGGSESGLIVLEDELPAELSYVQGSSSVNGIPVEPERSGGRLRWVLPPLSPDGGWEVTFSATVVSSPVGTDRVYNAVIYGGEEVARAPLVIIRPSGPAPPVTPPAGAAAPRLWLSKECSPAVASVGDVISCRIVLTNVGNATASNLTVIDFLPRGLVPVEGSESPPSASLSAGMIEWRVRELPPGGAFAALFHAVVTGEAGGSLINVARAQNLTATFRINVRPPTPLRPVIGKVGTYLGNQTVLYTVSVYFPGEVSEVTVVDRLPGGASLVPGGVRVAGAEYAVRAPTDRVLRIVLRPSGVGTPATVTYLVRLPSGLAGDVVNVAELREYGLAASSVVRVPATLITAAMGGASAIPAILFLLLPIGVARRRVTLYDAGAMRFAILAGWPGGITGVRERVLLTRPAVDDLMDDPATGPALVNLIRRGIVEVREVDEGSVVQALMLARTTGMSMGSAANLIAAVVGGATSVVLSDMLALSVARSLGLEAVLVAPTFGAREGESVWAP